MSTSTIETTRQNNPIPQALSAILQNHPQLPNSRFLRLLQRLFLNRFYNNLIKYNNDNPALSLKELIEFYDIFKALGKIRLLILSKILNILYNQLREYKRKPNFVAFWQAIDLTISRYIPIKTFPTDCEKLPNDIIISLLNTEKILFISPKMLLPKYRNAVIALLNQIVNDRKDRIIRLRIPYFLESRYLKELLDIFQNINTLEIYAITTAPQENFKYNEVVSSKIEYIIFYPNNYINYSAICNDDIPLVPKNHIDLNLRGVTLGEAFPNLHGVYSNIPESIWPHDALYPQYNVPFSWIAPQLPNLITDLSIYLHKTNNTRREVMALIELLKKIKDDLLFFTLNKCDIHSINRELSQALMSILCDCKKLVSLTITLPIYYAKTPCLHLNSLKQLSINIKDLISLPNMIKYLAKLEYLVININTLDSNNNYNYYLNNLLPILINLKELRSIIIKDNNTAGPRVNVNIDFIVSIIRNCRQLKELKIYNHQDINLQANDLAKLKAAVAESASLQTLSLELRIPPEIIAELKSNKEHKNSAYCFVCSNNRNPNPLPPEILSHIFFTFFKEPFETTGDLRINTYI